MLKTVRVMLIPNKKQRTRLFQFAGSARFAYNWALEQEKRNYDEGSKFLNDYELRKRFTLFKNEPENRWLYTISNNVCKQAIKDAVKAYEKFFEGLAGHPKYKSRKRNPPKFYADPFKDKNYGDTCKAGKHSAEPKEKPSECKLVQTCGA